MAGEVPFLVKDLLLLVVSIYLLKQDLLRFSLSSRDAETVAVRPRVGGITAAA